MTTPNYDSERRQYERALEQQRDAAVDACEKALKAIGVYVTDKIRNGLHDAFSDWI